MFGLLIVLLCFVRFRCDLFVGSVWFVGVWLGVLVWAYRFAGCWVCLMVVIVVVVLMWYYAVCVLV